MLLENRVALVSGIGPGMGRDISLRLAREGGSIVMISTMSTRIVNPTFAAYAASKAALNAATQGLARELGPYQIRVNAVLPGYASPLASCVTGQLLDVNGGQVMY